MASEILTLSLDESNKVDIHFHGATLTSWVSNNREILFVSKNSVFDQKKAIRGGIPVCFPNFGPWDNNRPQHGFARTKRWSVKEAPTKINDSIRASLSLADDEETRQLWNHSFELIYHITLTKSSLTTRLEIKNTGKDNFDFTCLLHTYFKVDDIQKVKVHDLNNLEFIDKVKAGVKDKETRDVISIDQENDRVYISTQKLHRLDTGNGIIKLEKENFPDTVLWNPWIAKAKAMADFGDEEYKNMVCLEAGHVNDRYVLKPNESVTMGQTISV